MKEDLIGLSTVEETIIKCGDCGTPLVEVVVVESNLDRMKRQLLPQNSCFKVKNCYKCGGDSFKSKRFEGTLIFGPLKDSYSIDVEDTEYEENGIGSPKTRTIETVLRVRKNK